jgi:hypothetical protein
MMGGFVATLRMGMIFSFSGGAYANVAICSENGVKYQA